MIISLAASGRRLLFSAILFLPSILISAQVQKTEILWDNYGVPHIYATTTRDMYYAFGWSQMTNHANLLLQVYGQARARAAEYWGSSWLESDKQLLAFDLPEKAKSM